jgi:hypothetical protein
MQTRQKGAGLVFGTVFLMIPGRWAAAAEGAQAAPPAAVEGSTPPVNLPAPDDFFARAGGGGFYDLVGRPDLRERYEMRRDAKFASRVAGGIGLITGTIWWIVDVFKDAGSVAAGPNDCGSAQPAPICSRIHWGPDILMGVGAAALIVPAFVEDDPLTLQEREDLVRKPGSRPNVTSLSLAPRVERDGASLGLSGRF